MDDPDINVGSEWLLGDEVRESQSDVFYDDNDLGWLDVEVVSGATESIFNIKSHAALQKAAATTTTPTTARSPRPKPSKSKGKGKQVAVTEVDEYDPEFVNNWGMKKKRMNRKRLKRKRMRKSTQMMVEVMMKIFMIIELLFHV